MSRAFRNTFVLAGLVALVALSWAGCTPGQGPAGDNDRPPIIVSSGSVHLRAVAKDRGMGTNEDRGGWKNQNGLWFHDHGGPPAKHLVVNVIYGTGEKAGSPCSDPEHNFDVRELSVTYTDGTNDTSFKVYLEGNNPNAPGRLMTDAQGAVDPKMSSWLDVGNAGDMLKSVTIAGETCTTADPGKFQVHIYQSTK